MLANLRALFGVVVDIILLRRGPESVPASQVLLGFVVVLNIGGSALFGSNNSVPFGLSLAQSVLAGLLLLAWYHVALSLAQKRERFLQTMTAMLSVNALFLPPALPLYTALLPYMEKQDPASPPPAALTLLALGLGIWLLVVEVRILRLAFEWHWLRALLLFLGQYFFTGMVSLLIFGSPDKVS
jgi:hypothetical protein